MPKRIQARTDDTRSPALLRSQGCLLPRWSSQWIIGDLSLSADSLTFVQSGKRLFEVSIPTITDLAVRQRKFILLRKKVVQLTYTLPDAGREGQEEREKKVWFIAPHLRRWIEEIRLLTGIVEDQQGPSDLDVTQSPPAPNPLRWISKRNREAESVCVREDQVRDLAAAVCGQGAEVLWYLWQVRHADIEDLATLIHASTHMDVLTLLREGINASAIQSLGGPVLVFKERAFDKETGRNICFQWWLDRVEETHAPASVQPLVEIHDEGETLLVVTMILYDNQEAPSVIVRDGQLSLSTGPGEDAWEISALLPCEVHATPIGVANNNGVLSLRFAKKAKE